jgi:hypothetical protein
MRSGSRVLHHRGTETQRRGDIDHCRVFTRTPKVDRSPATSHRCRVASTRPRKLCDAPVAKPHPQAGSGGVVVIRPRPSMSRC